MVRRLLPHYAWLTIIGALVGCMPSEAPPTPGRVSLEFDGMSDSEVTFRLANGLNRAIYIPGSRTFSLAIGMSPYDTQIQCEGIQYERSEAALFGFVHGKSKFIEVSPGKRVKLFIPTTLPQRYKGGRCRLELVLKDGTIVGPSEFQP